MDPDVEFDAMRWASGALAWERRLRQLEAASDELPAAAEAAPAEVSRSGQPQRRRRVGSRALAH